MNFAQEVLRRQYSHITGLQLTLTLQSSTVLKTRLYSANFLQIIHCRMNHWIVASTLGSYPKVLIYDSIYQTVDETTLAWLKQFFGTDVEVTIDKQEGVSDSGFYAVSLANNRVPGNFIQSRMRNHLITCFEDYKFTEFPGH